MRKKVEYEKRLTLFIDFLGFSEIVESTVRDRKKLKDLVGALNEAAEIASSGNAADFHATQFSDCIVISYKADKPDALFEIVNKLSLIVVCAAARGYLIRGGLTFGDLLHTNENLVGPAMVRAYQLESKIAKAPRVILDPVVFDAILKSKSVDVVKTIKKYLKQDRADGLWYFDYFSSRTVVATVGADVDSYPSYLATLARLIELGLKNSDPRVLEKHVWMQRRYGAARKPFVGRAKDHPDRFNFPGYLESIENLPSLTKEVEEALEVIAEAAR